MERILAAKKQQNDEKKKQQQEETRRKQALAELEQKRKADENVRKMMNDSKRRAVSQASKDSKMSNNGKKSNEPEERDGSTLSIMVQEDVFRNFGRLNEQKIIEVPPNQDSRKFNECQILGDLDRNRFGKIVVGPMEAISGSYFDNQGRKTNQRGYLVDSDGNVINNVNQKIMFMKEQLDERDEIPQPFHLESHGFNPHAVRGNFDIDAQKKWIVK